MLGLLEVPRMCSNERAEDAALEGGVVGGELCADCEPTGIVDGPLSAEDAGEV